MEKSVIKRLQSASYSFVAFFFVVFMWACPKFFVKEFCFTLFIGSITLLVVCAIVAQVYLYVRHQDNSRLSWLCTAFLILLLLSQCLVVAFPLWSGVIYFYQYLIVYFLSNISIHPSRYKGDEFKPLAMFSINWVAITALLYMFFQMDFFK